MFGIITCSGCGRSRIIDLGDEVTRCPYCNRETVTKKVNVIFQHRDQSVVRDALDSMSGFVMEERKKVDGNIDPMSTLEYQVEHENDLFTKMGIIAEGLTRIEGTFTVEDVDSLVPGKGEKYIKAMLTECMIYEVGYGKYRC